MDAIGDQLPGMPRPFACLHGIRRACRSGTVILKKPPVARCTEGRKRNECGSKKSEREHQTALRQ
jgi:hypothetical protein